MIRASAQLLLLLALLAFFPAAICRAQAQSPQDSLLRGVTIQQHLNAQIPLNLTFKDETNSTVHLSNLQRGKPIVLVLVQFGCPSLCTTILNDMLSTLKVIPQTVGTDYDVWTVSFDPSETPTLAAAKKGEYVRSYLRTRPEAANVSTGWHFLTGDADNIRQLTQAVGYSYRWDAATNQFIHPAALILLTPELKVSRYFFGIDYDPTDLRLSLVEASHGTIGTFTDKILLFCYHYDPATGKYGLAVTNALRVGGLLTLLILAAGFALLWRADRRRTQKLLASTRGAAP